MSRWRLDRASTPRILAADRAQLAWLQKEGAGPSVMAGWSYRGASPALTPETFPNLKPGFIDLIAGSDVTLHWVQVPPASVASLAELRLVAQARCAHLYGGTPGDWRVGADWHASRPFVCMALQQNVVLPIETALAGFKLVPRWHSAWSVLSCGLSQAFPADGWSAVRSPARVVLWHCRNALVDCVATWPVDPQETSADAARRASQQMQVEISRSEHSSGGLLHWVDLVVDGSVNAGELPGVLPMQRDSRIASVTHGVPSEAAGALALRALVRSART